MSFYNFFLSCLETAKKSIAALIKDKTATRRPTLQSEISEILGKIDMSLSYGELTHEQAKYLKDEFSKLNFMDLSGARAALRQSEKYMRR